MAGDGSTANYQFILPDPGGAVTTWGISLNSNWNKIDGLLKSAKDEADALTGKLTVNSVIIERGVDGGAYATVAFMNHGRTQSRWLMGESSDAESGTAGGSNLVMLAYDNNGAYLGAPFTINRASMRMTLIGDPVNPLEPATKQYVDRGPTRYVGEIKMWGGDTPPTGWLWCNGGVYLDTDVPLLVPVLKHRFPGSDATHTAVPNMNGRVPVGYDGGNWALGLMGGEFNHQLSVAELPGHTHPITDVAHNHGAYQNAHNHTILTGNHGHGIHTGSHAHSYNGPTSYPVGAQTVGQGGSSGQTTSSVGDLGGYTDTAGNLGGYTDTQTPGVGIYASGTGLSTTQGAGSWAAHNIMQPYAVVGFIIRYN
jgi:microcystin-dependent protein